MNRAQHGFSLIEVMIATTIMAVGILVTTPLFVYAARENAVGGDLGSVGALAVERMEELRGAGFAGMANGGSLDSNVDGYFDGSNEGFVVRWTIADNPNPPTSTKIVTVRAMALRQMIGRAKQMTITGVRGL